MVNDLLDVYKMTVTVCKNSFPKSKPKEIVYKNYKNFDINTFKNILGLKVQTIKIYKNQHVFLEWTLNEHVLLKAIKTKNCPLYDKVITQSHYAAVWTWT